MFSKYAILYVLLITATIAASSKCFAQREADNWIVLTSWLNFGGGNQPQVAMCGSDGGISSQSSATISDKNGNLLFYTDGIVVINRNNQKMPFHYIFPSNHLFGCNYSVTSGQNVIITPYPGHDSLYYIFYVSMWVFDNYATSTLRYAIVNMNKDNGLGDVVLQDEPVFTNGENVCLKMNATLHCNKKDIWLVGHLRNSDKYYSLPITSSGIGSPVFSSCNMIPETTPAINASIHGMLKIDALGDKLATAQMGADFTEVCNFNNQTGIVSDPKKIYVHPEHAIPTPGPFESSFYGPFSVDFSPSGNKLYLDAAYNTIWTDGESRAVSRIFQFDATQTTETGLQNSAILLDTLMGAYTGMQLGNDGRIYFCPGSPSSAMGGIANPEATGLACNFSPIMLFFYPYTVAGSLPSFVQSYFRYPIIATGNCQFQNISFNIQNPIGVSSVQWDFGDPSSGANNISASFTPTHIFTSEDTYTVTAVLQNSNGCSADTIRKVIHAGPFKVFLGNDTTICQGDSLKLRMQIPGGSNFWSTGSFDSVITIKQPGTYSVRVSLGDCVASDTITVSFRDLPQFTLGTDTVICNNQSVTLSPHPGYASAVYLWSTNEVVSNIIVNDEDDYWLQLSDDIGCKWRDTLNISFKTLPEYTLGNDTAICQKDSLQIDATVNAATGYLWNTAEVTSVIKVYQTNYYWCDVNKDGCTYRDSIYVVVKPLPIVQLGNDTTVCEDKTLLLTVTNPNSTYLWQDGNINDSYLVSQNGQYYLRVTMNDCVSRDTINVSYKLKPRFTLGSEQLICSGQPITIKPVLDNSWQLLWQDGTIGNTYTVVQPGNYRLTATNECGSTQEELLVKEGLCELYIPNAFTPNNDTRNDVLKVFGTEKITDFDFRIYNRYGQLVFRTKEKAKGWDGNLNGIPQTSGSYIWILNYRDINYKSGVLKGICTLIR